MSNVTCEDRPRLAQAVQLQDGLFAQLKALDITESDLLRDVDGIIMQAFCLGQTEAAEAIAAGAKVQGYLYDVSGHDLGYEVAVSPTRPPLNPSFDECRCNLAALAPEDRREDARSAHDMILAINEAPFRAIAEILTSLQGDTTFVELGGILGRYDFDQLVSQHNWIDPVSAHQLAQELDRIRERANKENEVARAEIEAASRTHADG